MYWGSPARGGILQPWHPTAILYLKSAPRLPAASIRIISPTRALGDATSPLPRTITNMSFPSRFPHLFLRQESSSNGTVAATTPAATTPQTTQQQTTPAAATTTPAAETTTAAPTTLITTTAPAATSQVQTTTQQQVPTTTTQQTTPQTTTAAAETTQPATSVVATTVVITPTVPGGQTSTVIQIITQTEAANPSKTTGSTSASASSTNGASNSGSDSKGGLTDGGKIAVAVVVPIAAVALLILAGIYFWRKRKQRKHAEEERRKEVEDYAYNPNADPTIPSLGDGGSYEMKEDGSAGYRGWGTTTLAGSTGRKASTTMSGGNTGEPLINDGSYSPDGEILGAMGPSAALNRGPGVQRGPSNASSSYSAGNRSDTSDGGIGMAYTGGGGGNAYYDQYGNNPYSDNPYGDQRPTELPGQPVIRDNPARRNTRIENPSHYPQQQNAGISQNF